MPSIDMDVNEKADDSSKVASSEFSDKEHEILNKQLQIPEVAVGYAALYRYASREETAILFFCSVLAAGAGVVMPLMTIIFGQFAGSFSHFLSGAITTSHFNHQINEFAAYYLYLGIGSFITTLISMAGFSYVGQTLTQRIRGAYLRAILRQNIAFFDSLGAGEITSRIAGDMNLIQDGISHKVALTISGFASFFAAIVISFVKSWRLALIMLSVVVATILVMGGVGKQMKVFAERSLQSSAVGVSLAEEAISSVRIVTAYAVQDHLTRKYNNQMMEASRLDFRSKAALGLMIAAMMCILNLQYGLAFWQGGRFLKDGDISVSHILTVLFASMMAGVSLGHIAPHLGAFGMAIGSAQKIFATIDRPSPIDPDSGSGNILQHVDGELKLEAIKLVYPSRPSVTVLDDFSLTIPSGKTTAIVGPSGSGKSSVIGLIERFYLPVDGKISLDGHDLNDLNLRWLRSQMSLVGQDPVLFNTTIYDNIAYGLSETSHASASKESTDRLVENAARIANAYEFISSLPEGFHTAVGERGNLLSGGQKQRIAIARAIVSNPKILLLDEATAALDSKSETAVQIALEAAAKGRTTVVIAHRLSTIKAADNIVVVVGGKVVEHGSHEELMGRNSAYSKMIESQQLLPHHLEDDVNSTHDEVGIAATEDAIKLIRSTDSRHEVHDQEKTLKDDWNRHSVWEAIKFIWYLNHKEKPAVVVGILSSLVSGANYPVLAIIFGNAITALTRPSATTGGHDINFWALLFLMLGLVELVFYLLQGTAFAFASAQLVQRARYEAYRSILRQDISFFDQEENRPGSLASLLSTETVHVAGVSGTVAGATLNFIITIGGAIAVGCSFGWKLALVCTSTVPILLLCGWARVHVMHEIEVRMKRKTDAATFACEAASAIRTVASLNLERELLRNYESKLGFQAVHDIRHILLSSLFYALSQSFILLAMGLAFWYGGRRVASGEYTLKQVYVVFVAMIWGAQAAGAIFSYAPEMTNATHAAVRLKWLVERIPLIDSWSNQGDHVTHIEGLIEVRNVSFAYPSRPEQLILRNVNLTAKPGEFVALVGASGSGKSTVISLLERFYDVRTGSILVDGREISTYNLRGYRSQLALVSQETILFSGTIKDNIIADDGESVADEDIVKACQAANIQDYIVSLPDGIQTLVGAKGNMLSGGQRQRLAIAKALLRAPKILLLDEATSALDSESEHTVQVALDRAASGRTTIAVSHRLSTIQHADMIYVFDQGSIVEAGRHLDLMDKRGKYWELVKLQELGEVGAV